VNPVKKHFPFIIVVVLLMIFFRMNETKIRDAFNLPKSAGSSASYSMEEFKKKHGWGISEFYFDSDAQTFSYNVYNGGNSDLYLNNQFIVERIPYSNFSLRPEIMNVKSKGDEIHIGPNEVRNLVVNLTRESWGAGTYRAVLNLRKEDKRFHWMVIYDVGGVSKVYSIKDMMFEGVDIK
jgi:hypothetical protein